MHYISRMHLFKSFKYLETNPLYLLESKFFPLLPSMFHNLKKIEWHVFEYDILNQSIIIFHVKTFNHLHTMDQSLQFHQYFHLPWYLRTNFLRPFDCKLFFFFVFSQKDITEGSISKFFFYFINLISFHY